ncbi:hypothetical protein P8452_76202 [Trifolium repens]|nr:hypothetical protein P8452_76202 [Trifolium repens]
MEMKKKKEEVSEEAKEKISERLSSLENLWFPRAQQSTSTLPSQRKSIFLDLLSRDPPLFLERYGSNLTSTELTEFDSMKHDYEINWHVTRLRSLLSPSPEELRKRSVMAKNRRRAYLDRLMIGGQYFSEDSMRDREPYLHHEYVGKFQDRVGRSMARPGERWSDTLLRRCEEAAIVAKIRGEQQRIGVPQRDWIGNEDFQEEEEEEEEGDDDVEEKENVERHMPQPDATDNAASDPSRVRHGPTLSSEELEDRMNQFIYIMQQKFLLGEDHEHVDYSKIDNDETLDDHWQREANVDAEERYFADD